MVFMAVAAFGGLACQTVPERTYPVHGKTTQDLLFDLKDNPTGPKDSWGHRGAAMTLCRVGLDLQGEKKMTWSSEHCSCKAHIKRLQLKTEIEVTMPKWVERENASRDCKAKWQKFLKATRYHEEGHVKICRSGIENIQRRLDKMTDHVVRKEGRECASVCDAAWNELKWEIERVYKFAFQQLQNRQIDYDEKTRHGQLQGGILETCRARK